MFADGVWLYHKTTQAQDATGKFSFWSFVAFLSLLYVSSILSPPAPSWRAVASVSLAGWLLPVWAAWFDRHRTLVRYD
jgi:hypothetical protein